MSRRTDGGVAMEDGPAERTAAVTVVERFRVVLQAGDLRALPALFTPDALLDANLPSWRLRRQGAAAVARQIASWFPGAPAEFVEWRPRDTPWGAVVECVERRRDGGEEVHFRQAFLFVTEGDRIAEFTFYCTGAWDAATRERHAREEPVVPAQ